MSIETTQDLQKVARNDFVREPKDVVSRVRATIDLQVQPAYSVNGLTQKCVGRRIALFTVKRLTVRAIGHVDGGARSDLSAVADGYPSDLRDAEYHPACSQAACPRA
jgi:hypothetical protein